MSAASLNYDQKIDKLSVKQPRLEKHIITNVPRAIHDTLDMLDVKFAVDTFDGEKLLWSSTNIKLSNYTVYSFGTNGGEFHYNKDKACVWAKYTIPVVSNTMSDSKELNLYIDIASNGSLKFGVYSSIRIGDRDDGTLYRGNVLEFDQKGNNRVLLQKSGMYDDDDIVPNGKSPEVILPAMPKSVDVTVVPDLKEYKTTNERRLVLFMSTDIPELSCFLGYITESSKYIAPNMYDTTLGYWINIGPIYGQVDINTKDNRFYLSFERDYQSGKLVNQFIRTSFMPLRETLGFSEYVVLTDELWYLKYYDPRGSGKTITQEEFIDYNNAKATVVSQYLPKVLTGLLNYK